MTMKALYVTSMHRFSGKTAVCLALARRFQHEGYKVGYFKPVSVHHWEPIPGRVHDEDAAFVRRMLGLEESVEDLVGIILTPKLVREMRCGCTDRDLMPEVAAKYERAIDGKDIVLLEGGHSLREGLSFNIAPTRVADALDVPALTMLRFRNQVSMGDACIAAQQQLGDRMLGVVINAVPEQSMDLLQRTCRQCLEERGVPVVGALPRREQLQAISVGEMAEVLHAEFLALPDKKDVLVEQLLVGAMSVEQALPHIRRVSGSKAMITGGDRADMQLVALETAAKCLILTGNLRPMAEVLRHAEEAGVPVLLVRGSTIQTVEAIEEVFGKTRLGQTAKLKRFEALMEEYFDFKRLYEALELT